MAVAIFGQFRRPAALRWQTSGAAARTLADQQQLVDALQEPSASLRMWEKYVPP